MSATGNDFLIVDLRKTTQAKQWKALTGRRPRPKLAAELCDRHNGLGADGFVVLEPHAKVDFNWDFYNSDGSRAEMCGNAARAVSLFVADSNRKKELRFLTRIGEVHAKVSSPNVIEVRLPAIAEHQWNQTSLETAYDFVRAGVPHVVVRVPSLEGREPLRNLAFALKRLPIFQPEGTNVTFVRELDRYKIEAVTFERGVEDFTLSCGTGAIAAAHSVLRGEDGQAVEVQVPGGRLSVIWKEGLPRLSGPARFVAQMHLPVRKSR